MLRGKRQLSICGQTYLCSKWWLVHWNLQTSSYSPLFSRHQYHKGVNKFSRPCLAWVVLEHLADYRMDITNSSLLSLTAGTPRKIQERERAAQCPFQLGIDPSFQWTRHVHQCNHDKGHSREHGRHKELQQSIHPLNSSSKSLPLLINENEFIVTYLFHWLWLLRREDTKLSSFEIDVHWGKTIVGFKPNSYRLTGCESHLGINESMWMNKCGFRS